MRLIRNDININFVSKMKYVAAVSFAFVIVGTILFVMRGSQNFGIEFTGGFLQQIQFSKPMDIKTLRAKLDEQGVAATLQSVQESPGMFIIKVPLDLKNTIDDTLKKSFPDNSLGILREEMVGPAVGKDLQKQGFMAFFLSLVGILIYVSWRFELRYALGAILALFHDVLFTMGVFALCDKEISLQILAALLTILGYSLNDTIVVFDRVRESLSLVRKKSFGETINISINQTLSRTILTSMTTLFVVVLLFLFGGEVIHDFAFALLIGISVGTYSSIFIACALLIFFEKYFGKHKKKS